MCPCLLPSAAFLIFCCAICACPPMRCPSPWGRQRSSPRRVHCSQRYWLPWRVLGEAVAQGNGSTTRYHVSELKAARAAVLLLTRDRTEDAVLNPPGRKKRVSDAVVKRDNKAVQANSGLGPCDASGSQWSQSGLPTLSGLQDFLSVDEEMMRLLLCMQSRHGNNLKSFCFLWLSLFLLAEWPVFTNKGGGRSPKRGDAGWPKDG